MTKAKHIPEPVAEVYDLIERILHPQGRIVTDNATYSRAIISALQDLYEAGYERGRQSVSTTPVSSADYNPAYAL